MRSPERAAEGEIGRIRINRAFNGTKYVDAEGFAGPEFRRLQKKAQAAAWAFPGQSQDS